MVASASVLGPDVSLDKATGFGYKYVTKGGSMSSSKSVLTVFCCLLLGATASAQITITQGDIPNAIGDTFVTKVCLDSAFVSLGAKGRVPLSVVHGLIGHTTSGMTAK